MDTQPLHQAAQYLAAAGKSFLPEASDDSHTNLCWDHETQSMLTWGLNAEGHKLALNFESYSLDFVHPHQGLIASFALEGARHLDIINWIGKERQFLGIEKPYSPELHYELPYGTIPDDFRFPSVNQETLNKLAALRSNVDAAVKYSTTFFHHFSFIRIWPHHFDTGALGYVDSAAHINSIIDTVGLGMAIPDSMINGHYYYASGWNGSTQPDLKNARDLQHGRWINGDWKGAVLEAEGTTEEEAKAFFKDAIDAFNTLYA